jgi:hypothetical protein
MSYNSNAYSNARAFTSTNKLFKYPSIIADVTTAGAITNAGALNLTFGTLNARIG